MPATSCGLKCNRMNTANRRHTVLPTSCHHSEICGSQFQGDYSAPPPSESPRALLVAQLQVRAATEWTTCGPRIAQTTSLPWVTCCAPAALWGHKAPPAHPLVLLHPCKRLQVTNDDTRIVSLANPATGQVVARMVMGPGAELRPNGTAAAGFQRFPAAVTAAAGATATSVAALVGCLLYFLALMALLVTIPLSMTADAGKRAALAACEGPACCIQGQGLGRICICMHPGWSAPPSVLLHVYAHPRAAPADYPKRFSTEPPLPWAYPRFHRERPALGSHGARIPGDCPACFAVVK